MARTALTSYAWLLAETLTAQAEVSRLAGANEEAAESLRGALRLYEERHATSLAKRLTRALANLPA